MRCMREKGTGLREAVLFTRARVKGCFGGAFRVFPQMFFFATCAAGSFPLRDSFHAPKQPGPGVASD